MLHLGYTEAALRLHVSRGGLDESYSEAKFGSCGREIEHVNLAGRECGRTVDFSRH